MRIGEILLLREMIDAWELTPAIQQQPASGQRLVSLLISRALIDPDDGAMALSEQHAYPAALQRHLERRDPALVELVPPEIGRRWVVLPIGRSRRGGLVVAARDPTPFVQASLEHVLKAPVELAVTPAVLLERLVRAEYGDLLDELAPPEPPRRASITKDLAGPLAQLLRAEDRDAAEHHAIELATRWWQAALLVHVAEGAALGRCGTGGRLGAADGIILPIDEPSTMQVAYATRGATIKAPGGDIQDRLTALLGDPTGPAAAPVLVGGAVVAVLVVGDPAAPELRNPLGKLTALADALGVVYERLGHAG
jgi:hypothetical protein